MAQGKVFALLVSDGDESFEELKEMLKQVGLDVWISPTCEEVERLLDQTHPKLIFTATKFSDGNRSDIISVAEKATVLTNVIVVGRYEDTGLYFSTMENGSFDFIVPPFEADAIAHVVRAASEDVRRRREDHAKRFEA